MTAHTILRSTCRILLTWGLCLTGQVAHAAGSGGMDDFDPDTAGQTPQERSAQAFQAGLKHRDRALKHEARAARTENQTTRDKAMAKAKHEYKKAVTKQGEAIRLFPQNYQAANELGFALRKTGDFRKAIGAYNFALGINPDYHQAAEYRAEAFLALGMLDRTRESYMHLFRNDRDLADQLMHRIEDWIAERGGQADETEAAFIAWAKERMRLAAVTTDLSSNNTRSW